MSTPMKSSECIYPECGPTCRKNCPPLPTKPEPIEPTEEQKQAARDFMTAPPSGETVHAELARLLAEREAKLRGENDASVAYHKAQADAYRLDAQVLQAHLDTARAHARTLTAYLAGELSINDTLRARVAELENSLAACRGTLFADDRYNEAREAQHLADIKALREAADKVSMRTTVDGPCWCSYPIQPGTDHHMCCAHMRKVKKNTAHYDEMDAAASTEGGEG